MTYRSNAVVLTLLVILSQVGIYREGPSSKDMRKKMMNSYLFKATDVFYPLGTKQASAYPQLTESSLKYLESGLQKMLVTVTDLQARNADPICQIFKCSVPPSVKAVVVVANLDKPIAQSVVNEKGILEIRIDVHVLQATFRGSLLSALKDHQAFSMDFTKPRASEIAREMRTDDRLIADYLDFKQRVVETKTGGILRDLMTHSDSPENDPWFKMIEMTEQSADVQNTYTGTLMFLMAHEVGHFVLRHHQHSCDSSRCELFSQDELEADRYAGYLLGAWLAPISARDDMSMNMFSMLDENHFRKLVGFDTFFDDAYDRVGFVDPSQTLCHCTYPEPKTRQTTAQAGQKAAVDHYEQLLKSDPAAAQKTTPLVSREKSPH